MIRLIAPKIALSIRPGDEKAINFILLIVFVSANEYCKLSLFASTFVFLFNFVSE